MYWVIFYVCIILWSLDVCHAMMVSLLLYFYFFVDDFGCVCFMFLENDKSDCNYSVGDNSVGDHID